MSEPQHGVLKRQKTSFTPDNIPLRVLYQCYFFLNGLVMLILAILSYASFDDSWNQYNQILHNWQQPLIYDIRATNQSCQSTEVQLTYYNWPGTTAGCQCDGLFSSGGVSSGSCSTNQTRRGCRTIGSRDSVKMSNFPIDNFTYYTLCAQVDLNNTFYKNAPDRSCQPNQLRCGSKDDFFVCSNTNQCPIFDISPTNNYTDGKIQLPDGNYFYYTRKLDEQMPVVQFGIGEGSGLCVDSTEPSITSGRSDYTLMNKKKEDCSRDPRFTRLASTSEPSFYLVNNMIGLPQSLPGYSISNQYTWSIYKRGYILWKYSCRGDTLKSFIDSRADLDQILGYQKGQFIIAIIFFIVVSVGMSCMVLVNICGGDWPCISGKGTEEANKLLRCEISMKVICQLAYAIIIFISFSLVRGQYNYLEQLVGKNCTDSQTNGVLNLLMESLQEKIYVYNIVLLVLFIISIMVDLCASGYFYRNYKSQVNNFDQTATLNNNNNGVGVVQELPITGQPGYFPQYGQPGYKEQVPYSDQPQNYQPGYQQQAPYQGQPVQGYPQGYPQGYQPVNQQPYDQPFVQQPYQAPYEQQYPQQQYPQQYPQQPYGYNQAPQGNPIQ